MTDFSTAEKLQQKEVRKQAASQLKHSNLYLYIIEQLKLCNNPAKIARDLAMPKTSLQYHLNKLKNAGVIQKIGYGTWEVINEANNKKYESVRVTLDDPQTQLSHFLQDSVRGHAFVFTLKIPGGLRNWNNEKREMFLGKNNIEFQNLTTFGGGQRILFKGRKIWLTNKSVIVFEKSSYLADTAANSKSHAIHNLISLIKSLERLLHADFTFKAGMEYQFKVSRQHYALVKNALAIQYNTSGEKLQVRAEDGTLWLVIDNSYALNETETVAPKSSDIDNKKVQDFFNSLKDYPLTTDFVLTAMNGIQSNQQLFAQNMSTHVQAVRDLKDAVNALTETVCKVQPQSQRTLGEFKR